MVNILFFEVACRRYFFINLSTGALDEKSDPNTSSTL
jgi:hypothetical protein